ncbi:MAG: PEGA domain-containing protein, partial [Myxococcota bacterium]
QTQTLEVRLAGYEDWEASLRTTEGVVEQIAVLTPLRGNLTVETEPAGAMVWVDGVLRGRSPVEVPNLALDRAVSVRAVRPEGGEARAEATLTAADRSQTVRITIPASE